MSQYNIHATAPPVFQCYLYHQVVITVETNLCLGCNLHNPFNSVYVAAITDYFVNQMAFSRHAWLKGLKLIIIRLYCTLPQGKTFLLV